MNKNRRKEIDAVMADIEKLRAALDAVKGGFQEALEALETIRDDEQEYFDNMPESLQSGEKGGDAEAAISALETAIDAVSEITEIDADIDAIVGALDEAKGVS